MENIDTKRRKLIKTLTGVMVCSSALLCSSCSAACAKINHKKCVKCRLCVSVCPHDAISYNGKIKIDKSKCTGCAQCVSACVYGALSI